ncbi:MAG: hypothetical protein MUF51_10920, partial [Vicinamibacteria bacterium]|nr:hypothetical protein [Vicinamibacteria bacterium]
ATPEAEQAAKAKGLDPARLRASIPLLTDQELAQIQARAAQSPDIIAGHHRDHDGGLAIVGVVLLLAGLLILASLADYDEDYWDDCDCW